MSADPFNWPVQEFSSGSDSQLPGAVASTSVKEPHQAPSTGWVSFDDDNSAAAVPPFVAAAPSPALNLGWTQPSFKYQDAEPTSLVPPAWAATGPGPTKAPQPAPVPAAQPAPVTQTGGVLLPLAGALAHVPTVGAAWADPAAATFPSSAAAAAAVVVTAASNAHTASPGPPSGRSSFSVPRHPSATLSEFPDLGLHSHAPLASGGAIAPAAQGLGQGAGGNVVPRLQRPPPSGSQGPSGVPGGTSSLTTHSVVVPQAASVACNPFASKVNPLGATAAARSLDPFADLSLQPQRPRPPPMASAKGSLTRPPGPNPAPQHSQAARTAAAGPVSPPPNSSAFPVAAATQDQGVFPTFAALHQQLPVQPMANSPAPAATPTLASLRGMGGQSGSTAQPVTATSGSSTPGRVNTASWEPWRQAGVIETTAFDAFGVGPSSKKGYAASPPPPPASSLPPPPPYAEAVDMPSPPPISRIEVLTHASVPLPYMEALDMLDAQPLAGPPPPPYEVAVTLPECPPPVAAAPPYAAAAWAPGAVAHPQDPAAGEGPALSRTALDDTVSILTSSSDSPKPRPIPPSISAANATSPPRSTLPPTLPQQICVEVRLPPLKPKEAALPKRLVAGMGLILTTPVGDGVVALQWCLQHERGAVRGTHSADDAGPRFTLPLRVAPQRTSEDWDSAPSAAVELPSQVDLPTACCMLLDDVSGSLWTGHKDGWVVQWRVEPGHAAQYRDHWKAHNRGKVTSLAMSPWGELWTASSSGTIRAWSYPANGSAPAPNRLFECRRSKLAQGAAARASAPRAHSKSRLLALAPGGRIMWSAGRTGLALWGAYNGEYLGNLTLGTASGQDSRAAGAGGGTAVPEMGTWGWDNGQQQFEINPKSGLDSGFLSRASEPRTLDSGEEADAGDPDLGLQVFKGLAGAAKLAAKLGKKIRQNFANEVPVGSMEGAGPNEQGSGASSRGKVVALIPGLDGSMYVAYKKGVLEKCTELGRSIWSRDYGVHLHSVALVGAVLWLGCGDGSIRTASSGSGELLRSWKAHDFPVMGLAHDDGSTGRGSGLVFSLSENGSVRAWPAVPPTEAQLLAWRDGLNPCLRRRDLAVLATTWNVNETRPSPESLRKWLRLSGATEIVAIGLQEMEMGTSSVARDAAITLLSKGMLERGNQTAQLWVAELASALAATGQSWVRVGLRQMSGLVIVVFCREELQQHVGEVATANVACGVMGVGGNKGAVAVSMSVFRRRIMFVCSHFAAHQERVDERNDNYNKIVQKLHFDNTSKVAKQQAQQQTGTELPCRDSAFIGVRDPEPDTSQFPVNGTANADDDGHGPGIQDAAMLVWAGDFNYRIEGSYDGVKSLACAGKYAELFKHDQCRLEMEKGTIFRGLREPLLAGYPTFPPTYKYDKNKPVTADAAGTLQLPYDSSEKQRVPAWTDRVFYRGSRPASLDVAEEEVHVHVAQTEDYNCVLDVNESDHKPVYALLQVQLPAYIQDGKRRHSLKSAVDVEKAALSGFGDSKQHAVTVRDSHIEARLNGTAVQLLNGGTQAFRVTVIAERPHTGGTGARAGSAVCPLPSWLEVTPTTFILPPRDAAVGSDRSDVHCKVFLLAHAGDGQTSVFLRFVLHPLWGLSTTHGALGPVVKVTVARQ